MNTGGSRKQTPSPVRMHAHATKAYRRLKFSPILLAAMLAYGQSAPVHAQESATHIHIGSQPLSRALEQLARQMGLELAYAPEMLEGMIATPMSDHMTADQALTKLLAGTGMAFRRSGRNVAIYRPTSTETIQLAPVLVQGETMPTTEGTSSYTATGPSATSTGLNLSLRETPQSVTVMTRQRLDDQNLNQLTDVLAQTPGVYVMQTTGVASDASSSIYSRGFAVDTIMVDGVRLTNSIYQGPINSHDMALYDRVEVVRGASGLMNGMGTPGAAVNMIRKLPTRDFQAIATLDVGSWDYRGAMLDLSSPLNESGSVRGRLVGAWSNNGSYIDRLKEQRRVLYGVLEADLAPSTLLRAGVVLQWHNSKGIGNALPAYYSDGTEIAWSRSASAAPNWAYTDRKNTTYFAELEHAFSNDWQVKAAVSRGYIDSDEIVGWAGNGYPDRETGAGVSLWATRWAYKPRQDSLDLSAKGQFTLFGREHDLAFGAAMSRTSYTSPSYTNWWHDGWDASVPDIFEWDGNTPSRPPNPSVGYHGSDERMNSLYASLRLKPTNALAVILGARIIDWKRDEASHSFASGDTTHTLLEEKRVIVPYAGILYDLDDNWTVYGSYTSIFKPQNYKTPSGDYIDPLMGDSYELGLKGAFFDNRLNVAAAVYEIREDNKAVALDNVYAPDGSQAYEAQSGTKTRGFEIDVSGQVQPGWEVSASFARNLTQDSDGGALNTNVPQNTVKLYTSYRMDRMVRGLVLGGGVRWQSSMYSENVGPARVRATQASYAVVDLMARYEISKHVTATLNVNNVFDKKYRLNAGNSYYGAPANARLGLRITY